MCQRGLGSATASSVLIRGPLRYILKLRTDDAKLIHETASGPINDYRSFFLPRSVPLVASYSLRFGRVSKRLCRKLKIIRILEEYGHGIGKTTYHKRTDKWHDILFHIARPKVGTVCTRVCTIALNRISGTIKTKNDVFVYHWRCECARCWNGCYSANRCTGLRLPRSLSEWANGWKSRVLSPWPSWYHPSVCRR